MSLMILLIPENLLRLCSILVMMHIFLSLISFAEKREIAPVDLLVPVI